MANSDDDMDKPVTKRELHEALEVWGGALEARIDARFDARISRLETKTEALSVEIRQSKDQLSAELAQHADRILEETRKMVGVFDQKYSDLPGRVDALEQSLPRELPPKRPRRRRAG
jgi:hypothetical protein